MLKEGQGLLETMAGIFSGLSAPVSLSHAGLCMLPSERRGDLAGQDHNLPILLLLANATFDMKIILHKKIISSPIKNSRVLIIQRAQGVSILSN